MYSFETRNRFFDDLFHQPDLIWLSQNTTHLPVHPAVKQALLDGITGEAFHGYAPPYGFEALRQLIIEDLGLPGMAVMVTDGAVEALYHGCKTMLAAGDEMLVPDPGWKWPIAFAKSVGATVRQIPIYGAETGYRMSPAALRQALSPQTKLIYLVDPNNPTGACNTAQEIQEIAQIAREQKAILIHDCTYRHFARGHELAAKHYPEGTITTYSFSKWLGLAGLRIGAAIAHPDLLERLTAAPPNNLGSNVLSQQAAIAGLRHREEWMASLLTVVSANQQRIKAVVDGIEGLSLPVYPSHTNFMCLDVSGAGIDPAALVHTLSQRKILIRQAAYHSDTFADRFVKVGTSVPEAWVEAFCRALPSAVDEARAVTSIPALF